MAERGAGRGDIEKEVERGRRQRRGRQRRGREREERERGG